MRKIFKRITALTLTIMLCAALLPASALAADDVSISSQATYSEEVCVGSSTSIKLSFTSNYSITLESEDDTIATATVTGTSTTVSSSGTTYGKTIQINGLKTGETTIKVLSGTTTLATIAVSVVPMFDEICCYLGDTCTITVVSNTSQSYYTDSDSVNIDSTSTTKKTSTTSVTVGGTTTSYTVTTYTSELTLSFNEAGVFSFSIYGSETGEMVNIEAEIIEKISVSDCEITLEADIFTYDGSEKEPEVLVEDGDYTLILDEDYTLSYSGNVNAGQATVTVTGIGMYTGEATVEFTIVPSSEAISVEISSQNITVGETAQIFTEATGNLSYESSNEDVAIVDEDGRVTGINIGTAVITITTDETENYTIPTTSVTVNVVPDAPSITSLSNTEGGLTIEWEGIDGADGYEIRYISDSEEEYNTLSVNDGAAVSQLITGLENGSTYQFQIRSYQTVDGAELYSAWSNAESIVYETILTTPSLTSISNITTGVKVKWEAVDGAVNYRVYRKTSSGSWKKLGDTTSTSYTDTTAKSGKTYYYTVRCISADGASDMSSFDPTGLSITYIASPVLTGISNTTSGVKVKWEAVDGAEKYYVYRKTSGGSWKRIKTTTAVNYTDKTAESGTTYYYTVRGVSSNGTDVSSIDSTGLSIKYLKAGKISSLTNTSKGITVKWNKVTGAKGYIVYRKTSGGSFERIAKITSGSTVSYSDTSIKDKNGKTYIYAVRPYSGSTKGSYTSKTTVRLTTPSLSSVKNSSSKKMAVKWSKVSSVSGYQIQYSTSSSFDSKTTVTVSGASTVSKTISGLTKGKTYYVRIRTYKTVDGTKYYSGWSSKKSVKISK